MPFEIDIINKDDAQLSHQYKSVLAWVFIGNISSSKLGMLRISATRSWCKLGIPLSGAGR